MVRIRLVHLGGVGDFTRIEALSTKRRHRRALQRRRERMERSNRRARRDRERLPDTGGREREGCREGRRASSRGGGAMEHGQHDCGGSQAGVRADAAREPPFGVHRLPGERVHDEQRELASHPDPFGHA